MKRIPITVAALAVFLLAFTASASPTKLFKKYESVRQALLRGSVDDVQRAAKDLTGTARAEKQAPLRGQTFGLRFTPKNHLGMEDFVIKAKIEGLNIPVEISSDF